MFATHEAHLPTAPSVRTRARFPAAGLFVAALLVIAVIIVTIAASPWQSTRERAAAFPASLSWHVTAPAHGYGALATEYRQASDLVTLDGRFFVLDTGNSRILVQDSHGTLLRAIDGADGGAVLRTPMALATDGVYLYVANTGASQVLALETDGRVTRTLDLSSVAPAARPVRPVGLALAPDGGLLVSDPDNNRVLHLNPDGTLLQALGSGVRAGGAEGFNAPAGLAVDAAGFTYVVDTLNGRVVKLSPAGSIIQQFGRPGDTAGTFSRPKDVAVDAAGKVYVSDTLLAAVQVFAPNGDYLGFIGRRDPGDAHSRSLFTAPAGLNVVGDELYVVDRFAGVFAFRLSESY